MQKCANCNTEIADQQFCPECGALCLRAEAMKDEVLTPGHKLMDRYAIEQVLHTGTVNYYRANLGDRKAIIKERMLSTLGAADLSTEDDVLSFGAESALLTSPACDGLQKAYEYVVESGKEYLVLEYPVGEKLSEVLAEDRFGEDKSIEIAIRLCESVDALHRQGYVHLDIDPHNIVLSDNKVKLLMFGRTRKLGTRWSEGLTSDGYSAPELYSATEAVADPRSDIYSIGAVLYTLLTGEVLLPGRGPSEVLGNVPQSELARILLTCLATNPASRLKTTDELIQRLLAYQSKPRRKLRVDSAVLSDVGLVRQNNEDCALVLDQSAWTASQLKSCGLYIVADGMGGEQAGEVASNIAIGEISRALWDCLSSASESDYNDVIKTTIERANKEIYLLAQNNPAMSSMGTTVTLALRIGEELYLGHVGDSRAYLIRDGEIVQLTEDHSLVAGLLKAGMINADEAKTHPERGVIFRSLGNSSTIVVDRLKDDKLVLKDADTLVLCTDGLVNNITGDELFTEVTGASTADAACSRLVAMAKERGGEDNATVIVVKVGTGK